MQHRHLKFFVLLATACFIALVIFAAAGVRGTDQFWYVADTRSLMAGSTQSNSLFAGLFWQVENYDLLRPFVHDVLPIWGMAQLGHLTGPYFAWIITSCVLFPLGLIATYSIVTRYTSKPLLGLAAIALIIANPALLWVSSQPLLETMLAFGIVALFWILLSNLHLLVKCGLVATSLVALELTRGIFMPMIAIAMLYFLVIAWRDHRAVAAQLTLMIVAIFGVCLWGISLWDKVDTGVGIGDMIMDGSDGLHPMYSWLMPTGPEFSITGAIAAIASNLFNSIDPTRSGFVFHIPFLAVNLGVASLAIYLLRHNQNLSRHFKLVLGLWVCLGALYFAQVGLHQFQFRYGAMLYPACVICLACLAAEVQLTPTKEAIINRALPIGIVLTLVGGLAVDAIAATVARSSSHKTQVEIEKVQATYQGNQTLRDADRWVICYTYSVLPLTYIAPEKTLINFPSFVGPDLFEDMLHKVNGDVFLCGKRHTMQWFPRQQVEALEQVEMFGKTFVVMPLR